MNLPDTLQSLGAKTAIETAKKLALEKKLVWTDEIEVIFSTIANLPELAPKKIKDSKTGDITAIEKWIIKYHKGFDNRPSNRISNPPGTVADPIIDDIILGRITTLGSDDIIRIKYAHRLSMSAENLLGILLEEYLALSLADSDWYCAWGETVTSVDFVKKDGALLQVKNRSNSENSSSSRVRDGTEIKKWYRIEAKRVHYRWNELKQICNVENLSEDNFIEFVKNTLIENPNALAIEKGNLWNLT